MWSDKYGRKSGWKEFWYWLPLGDHSINPFMVISLFCIPQTISLNAG
jgi:hypothetical protein